MARIDRFNDIIAGFSRGAVGVIGDSVADVYVLGRPERISREAPVMVVRKEEERRIPGCAANTVNNIAALGGRAAPVTLVGDDEAGRGLRADLAAIRVAPEGVLVWPGYRTVTKTRIMVGDANRIKHQVIRIDDEPRQRVPAGAEAEILAAIERLDANVDAWLVSDYNYDVLSERVIGLVNALARRKAVVVDSRHRLRLFQGVRCLTPNEYEAEAAAGVPIAGDEDARAAGRILLERQAAESLVLTRGNKGMMIFEKTGAIHDLAAIGGGDVVDVSGAGDTVAAALVLALVGGASILEAAQLANCAASVVVMKAGAATCSAEELADRLHLIA